jgi:hypothetical protein
MAQPNEYIPGQVIVLQDVITNPTTGALVSDGSDAVTVYKPDDSVVSPPLSVSSPSTGTYQAQVTPAPTETGWWKYVWKSTGAGAGAGRGRFFVSPVP